MLGVTGPPGAGKSTFAAWLVREIGESAIVLPMDGFHLGNAELGARGLAGRKGAYDTYDVAGFVGKLKELRVRDEVLAPQYSRVKHEPEADAIRILPQHRIVIVEGNYLLVGEGAWAEVRPLLDEVWYLDAAPETAAERLIGRHMAVGRSREVAEGKVRDVDLPNGAIVARTRARADRVIATDAGPF